METENLKDTIQAMINAAFRRVEYAYQHHCEPNIKLSTQINTEREKPTRLVFPKYSCGDTRISEQELRFAFVEEFNASSIDELFYSIETPTEKKYTDFKTNPKQDDAGRSAEFDLVIFKKENDSLKRVCMIEFKAHSVDKVDYWKDILKLIEDRKDANGCNVNDVLSYFINLFGASHRGTIPTMKKKIKEFVKERGYENEEDIIIGYYILGEAKSDFKSLKDIDCLKEN